MAPTNAGDDLGQGRAVRHPCTAPAKWHCAGEHGHMYSHADGGLGCPPHFGIRGEPNVGRKPASRVAMVAAALALTLTALFGGASSVSAYNRDNAVAYAEAHWNECVNGHLNDMQPPAPYSCIGAFINPSATYQDCTNFVSQSMHAGGYSMIHRTDLIKSWWWKDGQHKTSTWVDAQDLYTFLTVFDHDNGDGTGAGGGWLEAKSHPNLNNPFNSLDRGDVIFFDQDNNGNIDHARFEVGWDAKNDYADQHSDPRHHDFWSGVTHFANPANVWVYQVRIDNANI